MASLIFDDTDAGNFLKGEYSLPYYKQSACLRATIFRELIALVIRRKDQCFTTLASVLSDTGEHTGSGLRVFDESNVGSGYCILATFKEPPKTRPLQNEFESKPSDKELPAPVQSEHLVLKKPEKSEAPSELSILTVYWEPSWRESFQDEAWKGYVAPLNWNSNSCNFEVLDDNQTLGMHLARNTQFNEVAFEQIGHYLLDLNIKRINMYIQALQADEERFEKVKAMYKRMGITH